jgi:polyribonucleotide nucleotidyltransferase
MIECESNEVPEDILKQAFVLGQKAIDESCDVQNNYLQLLSITPQEITFNKPSEDVIAYVSNVLTSDKLNALTGNSKVPFNTLFNQYQKDVIEIAKEKIEDNSLEDFTESKIKMAVFNVIKNFLRHRTLETGKRVDDRDMQEIRSIYCEVGLLPRVHGTGLFRR